MLFFLKCTGGHLEAVLAPLDGGWPTCWPRTVCGREVPYGPLSPWGFIKTGLGLVSNIPNMIWIRLFIKGSVSIWECYQNYLNYLSLSFVWLLTQLCLNILIELRVLIMYVGSLFVAHSKHLLCWSVTRFPWSCVMYITFNSRWVCMLHPSICSDVHCFLLNRCPRC